MINDKNQPCLTNVQLSEKRPVFTLTSVLKTTKRDEPVDLIGDEGTVVHNFSSNGELELEPS